MTKIIIESDQPIEIERSTERKDKKNNVSLFLGILVGYALIRLAAQHEAEIVNLKKTIKELTLKGE